MTSHLLSTEQKIKKEDNIYGKMKWVVFHAHSGPISAIAASSLILMSGSKGDDKILLTSTISGNILTRVIAHANGTTCISASIIDHTFVSSGSDREILVWQAQTSIHDPNIISSLILLNRLHGHTKEITCISLNTSLDIISGDKSGEIFLWSRTSCKNNTYEMKFIAHEGAVHALQCDSLRSTSLGADGVLVVCDLVRNTILQRAIYPHGNDAKTIALQFDGNTLVTIASNRTLHVWAWRNGFFSIIQHDIATRDNEHLVQKGETIEDICQKHQIKRDELFQLNPRLISDAAAGIVGRVLFPGMRLKLLENGQVDPYDTLLLQRHGTCTVQEKFTPFIKETSSWYSKSLRGNKTEINFDLEIE
jgi:WD40 repeat protein